MNQTIKKSNYDLFHKKFMEETGKDAEQTRQLMSKLKRAENQLHRVFTEKPVNKDRQSDLQSHVNGLLSKYKAISVRYSVDPKGSAIRLTFTKTGRTGLEVDW